MITLTFADLYHFNKSTQAVHFLNTASLAYIGV